MQIDFFNRNMRNKIIANVNRFLTALKFINIKCLLNRVSPDAATLFSIIMTNSSLHVLPLVCGIITTLKTHINFRVSVNNNNNVQMNLTTLIRKNYIFVVNANKNKYQSIMKSLFIYMVYEYIYIVCVRV